MGKYIKPPLSIADILLEKEWDFSRQVTDYLYGRDAKMEGKAAFLPLSAHTYRYYESGILTLASYEGMFENEYIIRKINSNFLEVYFKQERFFYKLDLSGPVSSCVHECGQDVYEGTFVFLLPSLWESRWRVKGPRKDMKIQTQYKLGDCH